MYKVVSVLPCMVEANRPMNESGPCVSINSVVTPNAAVPEIGLTSASGTISGGTPRKLKTGDRRPMNASSAPDARKIAIETIIPTKKGSKENAILTPSFPPSTNNSYAGTRFHVPTIRTIIIKHGMSHVLTAVIAAKTTPSLNSDNNKNGQPLLHSGMTRPLQ